MGAFTKARNILVPNDENAEEAAAFREQWGWEPHEQVTMRGALTGGVQEELGNMAAQQGTAGLMMLEKMIVGWTFANEQGHPMSVSLDNLRQLSTSYLTPLLEVCDQLARKGMSEEAQKRFLASANGRSPAR